MIWWCLLPIIVHFCVFYSSSNTGFFNFLSVSLSLLFVRLWTYASSSRFRLPLAASTTKITTTTITSLRIHSEQRRFLPLIHSVSLSLLFDAFITCMCVSLCTCLYRENSKTNVVLFDRTIRCWGLFLGGNRMISLSFSLSLLPRCSCFSSYRCSSVCACVFLCGCLMHSSTLSLSLSSNTFFGLFLWRLYNRQWQKTKRENLLFFFLFAFVLLFSFFVLFVYNRRTYIRTNRALISFYPWSQQNLRHGNREDGFEKHSGPSRDKHAFLKERKRIFPFSRFE